MRRTSTIGFLMVLSQLVIQTISYAGDPSGNSSTSRWDSAKRCLIRAGWTLTYLLYQANEVMTNPVGVLDQLNANQRDLEERLKRDVRAVQCHNGDCEEPSDPSCPTCPTCHSENCDRIRSDLSSCQSTLSRDQRLLSDCNRDKTRLTRRVEEAETKVKNVCASLPEVVTNSTWVMEQLERPEARVSIHNCTLETTFDPLTNGTHTNQTCTTDFALNKTYVKEVLDQYLQTDEWKTIQNSCSPPNVPSGNVSEGSILVPSPEMLALGVVLVAGVYYHENIAQVTHQICDRATQACTWAVNKAWDYVSSLTQACERNPKETSTDLIVDDSAKFPNI